MKDIIKKFNEITIEFLEQTASLTGNNYLNKFKMLIRINSASPIDLYIKNVLPYKDHIYNSNEDFFVNNGVNNKYMTYFDDIIGVQSIYSRLDETSKDNIKGIAMALTFLAEERYNMQNNILTK